MQTLSSYHNELGYPLGYQHKDTRFKSLLSHIFATLHTTLVYWTNILTVSTQLTTTSKVWTDLYARIDTQPLALSFGHSHMGIDILYTMLWYIHIPWSCACEEGREEDPWSTPSKRGPSFCCICAAAGTPSETVVSYVYLSLFLTTLITINYLVRRRRRRRTIGDY